MRTIPNIVVAAALLVSTSARAGELENSIATLTAFAAVDYKQSVDLFFKKEGYHEVNPLLGKHPSHRALFAFGVIGIGLTYAASQVLPETLASIVTDSIVASEQWNVEDNALLVSEGRRRINGIPIIVTWRF